MFHSLAKAGRAAKTSPGRANDANVPKRPQVRNDAPVTRPGSGSFGPRGKQERQNRPLLSPLSVAPIKSTTAIDYFPTILAYSTFKYLIVAHHFTVSRRPSNPESSFKTLSNKLTHIETHRKVNL